MAHELEIKNGKAMMAYAGDVPWHGLGTKVDSNLSPHEMLVAAGLNWEVSKYPAYSTIPILNPSTGKFVDTRYPVGHSALVRESDKKILDVVSDDWNPVQNKEAFDFFLEFIASGGMEMHTAGSLKGGQIVWALAKVAESFELFNGDKVDAYLQFTNFHKYGFSTDVRFTPIRVVCNNTLSLSLNTSVERMVKISHRREFKPEQAKEMLGIATAKLKQYKEMATFLGSKKAKNEDIVSYFQRIFPSVTPRDPEKDKKELSRNAAKAIDLMHTQPGSQFAEGSWWQPFNAVTFMTDHLLGRSNDTRMVSSWYGVNRNLKNKALETAIEMAEAS